MKKAFQRGGAAAVAFFYLTIQGSVAAYPRPTGPPERVSIGVAGQEAEGESSLPSISADGRYVAFSSHATNLVPGDTNGLQDVFIRDRASGVTQRISVSSDEQQAVAGSSADPSISADGRYVAFESSAANLVPGDTNASYDIFVRDLLSGLTERVSVGPGGQQANSPSAEPSISADGRSVSFTSYANNLVVGDLPDLLFTPDVFVRDRIANTTKLVSVAFNGGAAEKGSREPAISGNGRFVAFTSDASNLTVGDTNNQPDVFLRDTAAASTTLVSIASDGQQALGQGGQNLRIGSFAPAISADGQYVAFVSEAVNLVPRDTNGQPVVPVPFPPGLTVDVFVRDLALGRTERVSVASDGQEASTGSIRIGTPAISADGRFVAFSYSSSGLVPADTNGQDDVFLRDRHTGVTERVSLMTSGQQASGSSLAPAISEDGRHVAFTSRAADIVPADTNGATDVFVRDRGLSVGIGGLSSSKFGGKLRATGWANFTGEVIASKTDPLTDGSSGAAQIGAELTQASLTIRPEDETLLVRMGVASLPAPGLGGGPQVLYSFRFNVGSGCNEVRVLSISTEPGSLANQAQLYACGASLFPQPASAGVGTTGNEIVASVPFSSVNLSPGAQLSAISASTAIGEMSRGAVSPPLDEISIDGSVAAPAPRVELGIAPPNTPEDAVAFSVTAQLSSGLFSGEFPIAGLGTGVRRVWARACLGQSCASSSTLVQL